MKRHRSLYNFCLITYSLIISTIFLVFCTPIGATPVTGMDKASEFFSDMNRGLIIDYEETVPGLAPRVLALPPAPGTCFECGTESVTFTSWSTGTTFTGTRYAGRFVEVRVPDEWPASSGFTEEEIRVLLDRLDILYQHAYELIGREPSGTGLMEVWFTDIDYFGLGWPGTKHFEIINADWSVRVIRESLGRDQLHIVFPHEMMHPFDLFSGYLRYDPMDAHAWTDFIQGYLMYYSRMGRSAGGTLQHEDLPPDNFIKDWQRRTWEPYLFLGRLITDPVTVNEEATWTACVRDNSSLDACRHLGVEHPNPPWGGISNAIGLLHGPDAIKGTFDFLRDFVDNNAPPLTPEEKADLHIEALAAGSEVNLSCYVDAWRWYASDSLRAQLLSHYGQQAPLCDDQDSDGFAAVYGDCDDADWSIYPGAPETSNGIDDNCNGTVDEWLFREPSGSGFPNPQALTLPAQVLGEVQSGESDFFTFEVGQPGPVSIELCADLDLVGGVRVFRDGRGFGYHGVHHNCFRNTYELNQAGQWEMEVLGEGGYAVIVEQIDPWPIQWGRIEDPVIQDQGNSVRLTAVTESMRYVAEAPDGVRFWVSGYGFVGYVPYDTMAVLDWTPSPSLLRGSYSVRAQLMTGETPVSDVTPATVFRCETCPEGPAPPPNDNFADAAELPGSSGNVQGTNILATTEPGEPEHAQVPVGASVWWNWTAAFDGQTTFDTFGSDFDTVLAVYVGNAVDALTEIASNDDAGSLQSRVEFTATAGTRYSIAVDGYAGQTGNITLSWSGPEIQVIAIDIKPGNERNVINPRAKGGIWVAVLSDNEFDPLEIDISTVRFGPDEAEPIRDKAKDVNRDGLSDLLLRFKIPQTGIACGDTEATLTGETFAGQVIAGTDVIKTVGCYKK